MRSQQSASSGAHSAILALLSQKGPMTLDDVVNELAREGMRSRSNRHKATREERELRRKIYQQLKQDGPLIKGGMVSIDLSGRFVISEQAKNSSPDVLVQAQEAGELRDHPAAGSKPSHFLKRAAVGGGLALVSALGVLASKEYRTSEVQSIYFAGKAKDLKFTLESGPSDKIAYPENGPYDQRLGYSLIPGILERVTRRGYEVAEQARLSSLHLSLVQKGVIYPIYKEKAQAGLTVLDAEDKPLFSALYPQLIYDSFERVPRVIVDTLLLIENRDMLDPRYPHKNPTLDWPRLVRAAFDNLVAKIFPGHESPGGSTLATQIEKYRHSPEGRTVSIKDKAVQMISATLRAYQDGQETTLARQRVITDYINSVPLGAIPGAGEIRGIGHGLVAWHGANFGQVNALLDDVQSPAKDPEELKAKALAFKQVLSLFLAQRRPAYYLQQNREALKALTAKHLQVLVKAGVISPEFRTAVEQADLTFRQGNLTYQPERLSFVERKAANAVRVHLLSYFGFDRLYTLDRLDLKVTSTIDYDTQKEVQNVLTKLKDPGFAQANGLMDHRLLAKGNPADVIYSFTLRERLGDANVLRVQADNVDGPFNVSEGGKLELGSTAKLRTLVTYLEVIEELWHALHGKSQAELARVAFHPSDRLSAWAAQWLQFKHAEGPSLRDMLEAAMQRGYSGSPGEVFFTGGGAHRFKNFEAHEDGQVWSVHDSIRKSINLSFVRIMRDLVAYHLARVPHAQAMLQDPTNQHRREYLMRFANKEGREFLGHFYLRYRGMKPEQVLEVFLSKIRKSVKHLAAVHSVVRPEGDLAEFTQFVKKTLPGQEIPQRHLEAAFQDLRRETLTLQDRGYVAGVHPLELWLVAFLHRQPGASFSQVMNASTEARQQAYKWLFSSRDKAKQDKRIKIMLEHEAFQGIHARWTRLGYPFASLVPTYATALGSSGDKPIALADLMSIISSGGLRLANTRVTEMHFAEGTPFETKVRAKYAPGTRVLSPEVAETVYRAIQDVVDNGTAIRVKGAFKSRDGKLIPVGGKTGTGDNRYSVFAPGGRVIESKVMSRTATFVFYIGDRFFGTLTAYVPNAAAQEYNFTSALPVQILKILAPKLMPLIEKGPNTQLRLARLWHELTDYGPKADLAPHVPGLAVVQPLSQLSIAR